MAMADDNYSEFDYIPLKASVDNKRKVTRKRNNLQVKLGEKYPPEGHCSVLICSATSAEDHNEYRILELGGARRKEEATWTEGSTLTEIIISSDEEDISISSVTSCKTSGGTIRPLHGATMVDLNSKLLIWGGLDLKCYQCRDDLLVIEELPRQRRSGAMPHFDVTWVQTTDSQTTSRMGLECKNQTGAIPSGRGGHSMTKIPGSNKVFLFGGYSINRNNSIARWQKSCNDGRLYILDTDSYEWKTVKVPLIKARAFHSTNILEVDDKFVMPIIGGVIFNEGAPTHRESLSEITIVSMNKQLKQFSLSEISLLPGSPETSSVYLSSHASVIHNGNVIVIGGVQDLEGEIKKGIAPKASARAFFLNLKLNTYQLLPKTVHAESIFSTYGLTVHNLVGDDTILVLGGSSRQISLLSDRNYEPQECDNVPCTIADSLESGDPTWIQCDRCHKWLHTTCIKLKKIPEGKYFCTNCKR